MEPLWEERCAGAGATRPCARQTACAAPRPGLPLRTAPRFKPQLAQQVIGSVVRSKLSGATYSADAAGVWARTIADEIKQQLKGARVRARTHVHVHACACTRALARLGQACGPRERSHAQACAGTCRACPAAAAEPWAARFKVVVLVTIGEQRGAGFHAGARCFWDAAADGWAQDTFNNVIGRAWGRRGRGAEQQSAQQRRVRAGLHAPAGTEACARRAAHLAQHARLRCILPGLAAVHTPWMQACAGGRWCHANMRAAAPLPLAYCLAQETLFCVAAAFGTYIY